MKKSDGKALVDVHGSHQEKAKEYQEAIRETELNLLEFINATIEINETKDNPEMVSALAGLLKEIKSEC